MKYLIASDIHGNIEAFNKALSLIENISEYKIIILGDLVGYFPNINQVIDKVKEIKAEVIMGNHDYSVFNFDEYCRMNDIAQAMINYTKKSITKENENYLKNLPYISKYEDFICVHGSLRDKFDYINKEYLASINMNILKDEDKNILFCGHTHLPMIWKKKNTNTYSRKMTEITNEIIQLEENTKYIINVGSIGYVRDKDYQTSFIIYDSEKRIVEYKMFDYDKTKIIDDIHKEIKNEDLKEAILSRLFI